MRNESARYARFCVFRTLKNVREKAFALRRGERLNHDRMVEVRIRRRFCKRLPCDRRIAWSRRAHALEVQFHSPSFQQEHQAGLKDNAGSPIPTQRSDAARGVPQNVEHVRMRPVEVREMK